MLCGRSTNTPTFRCESAYVTALLAGERFQPVNVHSGMDVSRIATDSPQSTAMDKYLLEIAERTTFQRTPEPPELKM
jgi:hypothetical protein